MILAYVNRGDRVTKSVVIRTPCVSAGLGEPGKVARAADATDKGGRTEGRVKLPIKFILVEEGRPSWFLTCHLQLAR